MTDDAFRRIDALIQIGMRLARSAPSGRILLARIAEAIDPAWIPRPWGDGIAKELEAAAASAREAIEPRRVERVLRDAWGSRWGDELDELDLEPAAVTPSAQVHRGVLEGAPVAVKVLRPGLASAVRQDLVLLEGLLAPLSAAFPAVDPGAVVREFREQVLEELDLESEATVQRRLHRTLRDHPFLTVPAPVTSLARESVMVSEWVDGVPMWEADDPDLVAGRLVAFALGAARAGIVHADLHPDHVLVQDDGRLAILDFGAVRVVEADRVGVAASGLDAFARSDAEGFAAVAAELGWLPIDRGADALELGRRALAELAGPDPVRLDSAAVVGARDRLFDEPELLVRVIAAGALPPEDLWPARGLAQLFSSIARVGASGSWLELSGKALRDGWG
jgi:predicted unusual protein kinase regulating ubiquinone biosynthesis (AarF/ABC1/UbiB family)